MQQKNLDRASLDVIPLFSKLNPEELDLFTRHGALMVYQPGEFIFREGDPADAFWVVIEGSVEVVKGWGEGVEKTLRVVKPGDFIGELGVVNPNHHRAASGRAVGQVSLLEVPLIELQRLLSRQSNLALPIMHEAFDRFLKTEKDAIADLVDKNLELTQALVELKSAQDRLIQQEKIEHELALARQIQEAFLPHELPQLPGWEIAVYWKPAREVGGDSYDFLALPDGRMAIVVSDVAGKGVPAALLMAVTRNIFRASIPMGGRAGTLLAQINNLLVDEMPPAMFVTAFLAILDLQNGEIEYANAGHCLPILHSSGDNSELWARGMPLGLMADMEYEEGIAALDPGAWALFYSDALSEAFNENRELFGMVRLHEAVRRAGVQVNPADIIRDIIYHQSEFTGPDARQEDDQTLIVLLRQAEEPS